MKLVYEDGENQAVRMFLAFYGGQSGITTLKMRRHLSMAGYEGMWPEWANREMHLTKAGAQLWIRYLLDLEKAQQHPDDAAVDRFAATMKEKLAKSREKGRGGWETCTPFDLSRMLHEHVSKGDPIDVANFCMMLWNLKGQIAPEKQYTDVRDALWVCVEHNALHFGENHNTVLQGLDALGGYKPAERITKA